MRALVLQHIECEPPGVYEDVLVERGVEIDRVELDAASRCRPGGTFDAVIAMGGPMSVNDDADHPWLTDEKRAIAEAVRAGVPFWGVCLGVQLLAASLGARVYPGPQPEVGLHARHAVGRGARRPGVRRTPREVLTLQWHGDTFDLPRAPGAGRVARVPEPGVPLGRAGVRRAVPPRGVHARWRRSGRRCPPTRSRWNASRDRVRSPA